MWYKEWKMGTILEMCNDVRMNKQSKTGDKHTTLRNTVFGKRALCISRSSRWFFSPPIEMTLKKLDDHTIRASKGAFGTLPAKPIELKQVDGAW
ncbi:hypothetical protein SAY87_013960 [Trapa incisa]|uniref:Uncharacterized protein n=1 Tax=Trapa incisa TaxID=236973 RepID=A0AAN7QDN7_9MYRT|nr:hypothetical protein SAY87_013960 [Trapa incisa]